MAQHTITVDLGAFEEDVVAHHAAGKEPPQTVDEFLVGFLVEKVDDLKQQMLDRVDPAVRAGSSGRAIAKIIMGQPVTWP
jgi:hypothetical protein